MLLPVERVGERVVEARGRPAPARRARLLRRELRDEPADVGDERLELLVRAVRAGAERPRGEEPPQLLRPGPPRGAADHHRQDRGEDGHAGERPQREPPDRRLPSRDEAHVVEHEGVAERARVVGERHERDVDEPALRLGEPLGAVAHVDATGPRAEVLALEPLRQHPRRRERPVVARADGRAQDPVVAHDAREDSREPAVLAGADVRRQGVARASRWRGRARAPTSRRNQARVVSCTAVEAPHASAARTARSGRPQRTIARTREAGVRPFPVNCLRETPARSGAHAGPDRGAARALRAAGRVVAPQRASFGCAQPPPERRTAVPGCVDSDARSVVTCAHVPGEARVTVPCPRAGLVPRGGPGRGGARVVRARRSRRSGRTTSRRCRPSRTRCSGGSRTRPSASPRGARSSRSSTGCAAGRSRPRSRRRTWTRWLALVFRVVRQADYGFGELLRSREATDPKTVALRVLGQEACEVTVADLSRRTRAIARGDPRARRRGPGGEGRDPLRELPRGGALRPRLPLERHRRLPAAGERGRRADRLHAEALGRAGPPRVGRGAGREGAPVAARPPAAPGDRAVLGSGRGPERAPVARADGEPGRRVRRRSARRARGPREGDRRRDGDVHVRHDREAEGHRLHPREHRDEALRPRVRAPAGERGGRLPRVPAALPHVREVARARRDAVLGRDLRVRPLDRAVHPPRGLQEGEADGLHLRPEEVDGAARGRGVGGERRRGRRRGGGAPAGHHRRPAAARALRRGLPRPDRVPRLPRGRDRALLRATA